MKIYLVTDTSSDLTREEAKTLDVLLLTQPVQFEGDEEPTEDRTEFWSKLTGGKTPRTSQPSPEEFRDILTRAKAENAAVVGVFISSGMSGTYESAERVKEQEGYAPVYLVDCLTASLSEQLLVREAVRLREEGKEAEEIFSFLEELKGRIKLYACLDTLKYLVIGGRISKLVANLGTLINLKPVISLNGNGKVTNFAKAIGHNRAMSKLIEQVQSVELDETYPVLPIYSSTDENCKIFIKKAAAKGVALSEGSQKPIGATIGTHIGPEAYGVVYVEKRKNP